MAALPSATLYTNFFAGGFHESLRNFATGCRHFKALRCKTAPAEAMHAEKRRQNIEPVRGQGFRSSHPANCQRESHPI
jgi:hypothetical protein